MNEQWGRSSVDLIAATQAEINRKMNPEEIAKSQAAFAALPWWRKAWLRWRYR